MEHDPLLAQYLAERDAPCPACGYNLRGSAVGKCGECGATIQLGLARCSALGGQWWFFFFAFFWAGMYNVLSLGRQVWWVRNLAVLRGPQTTYNFDQVPTTEYLKVGLFGVQALAAFVLAWIVFDGRARRWTDAGRRRLIGWLIVITAFFWLTRLYFFVRDFLQ
jgi:hypothetical protein